MILDIKRFIAILSIYSDLKQVYYNKYQIHFLFDYKHIGNLYLSYDFIFTCICIAPSAKLVCDMMYCISYHTRSPLVSCQFFESSRRVPGAGEFLCTAPCLKNG